MDSDLYVSLECVSCVIQLNEEDAQWVSDSPYLHALDGLDMVHHQMNSEKLIAEMDNIGYQQILFETEALPNGKELVRIDFGRRKDI